MPHYCHYPRRRSLLFLATGASFSHCRDGAYSFYNIYLKSPRIIIEEMPPLLRHDTSRHYRPHTRRHGHDVITDNTSQHYEQAYFTGLLSGWFTPRHARRLGGQQLSERACDAAATSQTTMILMARMREAYLFIITPSGFRHTIHRSASKDIQKAA